MRAELEAGIMVEVPAAALLAEQLRAPPTSSRSGPTTSTQYTMAAERGNELVGDLLAGAQPAVLRLIRLVAAGAARTDAPWRVRRARRRTRRGGAARRVGRPRAEHGAAAIAEVKQALRP